MDLTCSSMALGHPSPHLRSQSRCPWRHCPRSHTACSLLSALTSLTICHFASAVTLYSVQILYCFSLSQWWCVLISQMWGGVVVLLRDGVVVLRVTIVCTLVRVSPHWPPPLVHPPLPDTARALCLQIHRHSAPHTAGQQRETWILTSIRQSLKPGIFSNLELIYVEKYCIY